MQTMNMWTTTFNLFFKLYRKNIKPFAFSIIKGLHRTELYWNIRANANVNNSLAILNLYRKF